MNDPKFKLKEEGLRAPNALVGMGGMTEKEHIKQMLPQGEMARLEAALRAGEQPKEFFQGGKKYRRIDPDDTVNLKGGEKFLVVKKPKDPKQVAADQARALFDAAKEDLEAWGLSTNFILQPNECSRLHKLAECVEVEAVNQAIRDGSVPGDLRRGMHDWSVVTPVVVKHDWLAAFHDSIGTVQEGELMLPGPITAFEFKINGKYATLLAYSAEATGTGEGSDYLLIEASNGVWSTLDEDCEIYRYVKSQVAAICVMLDAEVAEQKLVRQPTKLNEKRVKAGKVPLTDYHVIDLSRRHRADRNPNPLETGRKVRCHFRRGHWRHYADHRTWIKWMLVGDPDLGFVDKEYKL